MGDERTGGRTARDGLEHRRLDLDEAPLGEQLAQRAHDGEADLEHATSIIVGDEVDVALPEPGVDVGEAVPLVGERPQRLGEELERRDLDRQLALLRLHDRALGADPVAEVEVVEGCVALVADHRREEIARMLAGAEITNEARAAAERLIKAAS